MQAKHAVLQCAWFVIKVLDESIFIGIWFLPIPFKSHTNDNNVI